MFAPPRDEMDLGYSNGSYRLNQVYGKVFVRMGLGLLFSFLIASLPLLFPSFFLPLFGRYATPFLIGVSLLQLALVLILVVGAKRFGPKVAKTLFFAYSGVTGLTLSIYFQVFSSASVAKALLLTALLFAAMAFWGSRTRRDLTTLGVVGHMLLFGVLLLGLVNLVLAFVAPGLVTLSHFVIDCVTVAIFIGLTAYDAQKIKRMCIESGVLETGNPELLEEIVTFSALSLYLDFINLFIHLLSIVGDAD